ncbi:MAG: ParB/RepB/Spo0J family partition protein [Goleter apudmare HA4340-LM2]|jgi:ParB family chromosome partitioning protein|nr:ParB/RepB/Spo0J family partition protein [Goleter apudmare HA4340-LM2]
MRKKQPEVPQMRGVQDLLTVNDTQPQTSIAIEKIKVNPNQPRRWFDPDKMVQLAQSVGEHGILEPLLVRPLDNGEYELIAGERRLRAAKEVGLAEVPIISKKLSDKQALSISILENLQREDLNPVEEVEAILELLAINLDVAPEEVKSILNEAANAKKRNIELTGNVSRQLEQIESTLTGIGRFNAESFRTSRLPLLNLPPDILETLRSGKLEYTKARAIARVKDDEKRADLLDKAISQNLSLSQIKELIQQFQANGTQNILPEKVLKQKYSDIGKRLNQVKIWEDAKKSKKLEKLLGDIEKLLAEA